MARRFLTQISTASPLQVVADNLTATSGYLEYYSSDRATRYGWVGFGTGGGSPNMSVLNERSAGDLLLRTQPTTGGVVSMRPQNVEVARFAAGSMLVNKTVEGNINASSEVRGTGLLGSWVDATGTANLWLVRFGTGAAAAQVFISFRNNTTLMGTINMLTTTALNFNAGAGGTHTATSDYRLKDVLGRIEAPIERIKLLRPVRARWKESGDELDTFIAHEVAEVVPEAVVGKKDAVNDDGEIDPQGLDASKLIPLMVATIQEQQKTIEALTKRIEALEAA